MSHHTVNIVTCFGHCVNYSVLTMTLWASSLGLPKPSTTDWAARAAGLFFHSSGVECPDQGVDSDGWLFLRAVREAPPRPLSLACRCRLPPVCSYPLPLSMPVSTFPCYETPVPLPKAHPNELT